MAYKGSYPYRDESVTYNKFTVEYTPAEGETRLSISSFDVFFHRGERNFQLQDDFMRNILSSLAGRLGILEQFSFAERLDYPPGYVRLSYSTGMSKALFYERFTLLEQDIQNSVIPDNSIIEVDIIRMDGDLYLNEPKTYCFQFTKGTPADLQAFQALLAQID